MNPTAHAYLRLLRVGTLFSPAADVVAGLCVAGQPWSVAAVRAVAASVCAYAAGMVLNDHADRHVDAQRRPERPLPSGQIAPGAALALGVALIAACLALAPHRTYYALILTLVLCYDYLVKSSVAAGVVVMGTLRGLNLAAGAVTTTWAAPPPEVLVAAIAYAVYIAAITLLGVLEDRADPSPRAVVAVQCVSPVAACIALLAMPHPWPAAAVALVGAVLFVARALRTTEWTVEAIRGSMTWLLLGTMAYTGLLCLAAGRPIECALVLAAIWPARRISRRIMLT